jgi:hypothetical protein
MFFPLPCYFCMPRTDETAPVPGLCPTKFPGEGKAFLSAAKLSKRPLKRAEKNCFDALKRAEVGLR